MTEQEAAAMLARSGDPSTREKNLRLLTQDSPAPYLERIDYPPEFAEGEHEPTKGRKSPQKTPQRAESAQSSGVASITFEFPLPPTGCSPNNHDYGRGAGKARKAYKEECLACISRVDYMWGRMFRRATISMEFWLGPSPGRYHARDTQNAISAVKNLVDSIVEAGYISDDAAKYLTWGETVLRTRKESGNRACVVVTMKRNLEIDR